MRRALIFLAFACAGLSLSADIINWMVDGNEQDHSTFCYAQLVAEKEGGSKVFLAVADPATAQPVEYEGQTTSLVMAEDAVSQNVWSYMAPGLSSWLGYVFSVELLNEDGEPFLKSSTFGYSDLESHIKSDQLDQPTVLRVGSFAQIPIPEPTSGLMVLVGLAGLALGRRRA